VLVLVSLGLITVYFRESSDGPLHTAQRIGVSVLMPFEVAGERVARPFRDGWAYVSDLLDAKAENDELEAELKEARERLIAEQIAARENERLREALDYISGPRTTSRSPRASSAGRRIPTSRRSPSPPAPTRACGRTLPWSPTTASSGSSPRSPRTARR
jgi:hypothetical protein